MARKTAVVRNDATHEYQWPSLPGGGEAVDIETLAYSQEVFSSLKIGMAPVMDSSFDFR